MCYCDAGFQHEMPESGHVFNLLSVPQSAYNGRIGNDIVVYRIDVTMEMRLESGGCASPRLIIFCDKQPPIEGSIVKTRPVEDILEKSPIFMTEDVEEGDFPNLFRNPTNMTFQSFKNTRSQRTDAIVHLYDVYRDLHPDVEKLDVDNVPSKTTVKFTLRDLNIHVKFKNNSPGSIIMNNIGALWIGDYTGGVVLGLMFTRIYYHNL